jgi:uncharacterized protein
MDNFIQQDNEGVTLLVKVVPRSSKNGIAGISEGVLKITLTAPPVEGAANQALIETLAKICHLRKSDIAILSGQTARLKRVRLGGAKIEEIRRLLGL